jgi:ornithine cyclodeaminase/alanine dehydrogenase-like protein (mu-crystallin family)
MIGAGEQAHTQLAAVAAVRPLAQALVYARNAAALGAFCEASSRALGIDVKPARSPEECVVDADVIVTATDSHTPVIHDEWLQGDVHVNTIGANAVSRMELELETFARAARVVTDDVDQARIEAGELVQCVASGIMVWEDVIPLSRIVADGHNSSGGLSIFKSLGAAIEDVAVASAVYEIAKAQGRGQVL